MPAHLSPSERRMAHPLGVLGVAVAVSLLVIAAFSSRPSEEGTTNRLIQPATETSETVLGEVVERTTVPEAPAADAQGFTTTTEGSSGSGSGGGGGTGTTVGRPSPTSPSPTLGPPVSITAPPTTRPSTTTTSSTTTTTEPTTTTESTTTTAP